MLLAMVRIRGSGAAGKTACLPSIYLRSTAAPRAWGAGDGGPDGLPAAPECGVDASGLSDPL
eukprot:13972695-Heterocapsa_arctica.AAC.1